MIRLTNSLDVKEDKKFIRDLIESFKRDKIEYEIREEKEKDKVVIWRDTRFKKYTIKNRE